MASSYQRVVWYTNDTETPVKINTNDVDDSDTKNLQAIRVSLHYVASQKIVPLFLWPYKLQRR